MLLKRFAVNLLACALCVILITELSSALTVQSHSKQIQTKNEEDTRLELNFKTLKNWFHRQVDSGIFQPIKGTYFPRIFKKTVIILPAAIQL